MNSSVIVYLAFSQPVKSVLTWECKTLDGFLNLKHISCRKINFYMPKYNHKQSQKANTKLGTSMPTHFQSIGQWVLIHSQFFHQLKQKKKKSSKKSKKISYLYNYEVFYCQDNPWFPHTHSYPLRDEVTISGYSRSHHFRDHLI